MRSSRIGALSLGFAFLAACSDSSGPDEQVPQCTAADANGNVNAMVPFQARTFRGTEVSRCMWVTGSGANYLVVPQFASDAEPRQLTRYVLGSGGTLTAAAAALLGPSRTSPALRFENALRRRERKIARDARDGRERGTVSTRSALVPRLQQIGDTRTFTVLSSIPEDDDDPLVFDTVTATVRFAGQNILIYVDQQAPSGPNGLPDDVLTKLGEWFDRDLYPLDVAAFGPESDIDNNDRVIVLMTPVVNGLTPNTDCTVAVFGFFFGLDLITPRLPNSNNGEVFYSLVPDPQGLFGCARSVQRVEESVPTVFVHEFQHMISFNHHFLINRGPDEETWLDEGLAHMAEEVAARFYENKYGPPPPPRLFNDTANIFIAANLANSYSYLENTGASSLTLFESTGTLEERGAAWLFLRWLADLKDETIFRRLVQNDTAGIPNIEAIAGESFGALFGDFALALWTDSIPGHPRSSVPVRNRFKSRNLRQIYARLNTVAPSQFPRVYPLVPRTQAFGTTLQSSMYPGAMEFFFSGSQASDPAVGFRFTRENGSAFADALRPQLGVFRLP